MIIVSQDKDTILNFNDITKIYINNPLKNNDEKFEIIAENEWTREVIGYYKTEERAKEILEGLTTREIISERFKATYIQQVQQEMIHRMYDNNEPLFIYKMPEK